jgi:hypothetical protein
MAKIGDEGELLTPGIVVAGNTPRTLVVRAVGPGLVDLGVPGDTVLEDPRIAVLTTAGQNVANNNNWTQSGTAGEIAMYNTVFASIGAFPLRTANRDAALLNAFAPGNYILQAAAAPALPAAERAPATTGAVLVEIYELP